MYITYILFWATARVLFVAAFSSITMEASFGAFPSHILQIPIRASPSLSQQRIAPFLCFFFVDNVSSSGRV